MKATAAHILKGKSIHELEQFFTSIAEPHYRAEQAFRRINKELANDPADITEFPRSLRTQLKERNSLPRIQVLHSSCETKEGTEKIIFSLGTKYKRGRKAEAVWIASPRRQTVCVSSQIGCSLNCSFCATGTLPFSGNLQSWEILEQVYEFIRRRKQKVTNVVFMGMGEPLHNYENVIRAARILHHPQGLNLGARHITISTAGVVPAMERFIREREPFNLAVSLNHPQNQGRSSIMDINNKYPLEQLLSASRRFTRELDRRITFEYVMIPDINMSISETRQLIKIARSVRCRLNLIPLNTALHGWRRPSSKEIYEFQSRLLEADLAVFNRGSPGLSIGGACGMLALQV